MNLSLLLITVSVLLTSIVDYATRIRGGSFSVQAGWTILLGVVSLVFVVFRAKLPKAIVGPGIVLTIFLALGMLTILLNPAKLALSVQSGAQSLLVYGGFVGLILLSAIETYQRVEQPWYLRTGFDRGFQIATLGYGFSVLLGGPGSNDIFGARSFALLGLVAIAWFVASGHYGKSNHTLWAILVAVAVGFSLSRTATVTSLLMFPMAQISPAKTKTWWRAAVGAALAFLIAQLAFTYVPPIRDRFTDKGDQGKLAGFSVNTSGRDYLWKQVEDVIAAAPPLAQTIGLGAGATGLVVPGGQAHNDYLRLRHDFGILGFTLWVIGYLWLGWLTLRAWSWADRYDHESAPVHLAAFLGLFSVAISMLTDNVIVYIFVMSPLGILIGSSIGLHAIRRKLQQQYLRSLQTEAEAIYSEPAIVP